MAKLAPTKDCPKYPQNPQYRQHSGCNSKPTGEVSSLLDELGRVRKIDNKPNRQPRQRNANQRNEQTPRNVSTRKTTPRWLAPGDASRHLQHVSKTGKLEHWNRRCNRKQNHQTCRSPKKANCRRNPAKHIEWIPMTSLWVLLPHFRQTSTHPNSIRLRRSWKPSKNGFLDAGWASNWADSRYLFALGRRGSTIYRILHQEAMSHPPTELACWVVVLTNFA